MEAKLIRLLDDGFQTLGQLFIFDNLNKIYECKTLELSYKNNQKNISCIPSGIYTVKKTYSKAFQRELYEVLGVSNRSGIRIHPANLSSQLRGCIALGQSFYDINKDGLKDVTSSANTIEQIERLLPITFQLQII